MKVVNKKLNRAQLATICLLVISIVFLGAYFTVGAIADNIASNQTSGSSNSNKIELWEGESSYLNQPVAYPSIQEKQMLVLRVDGPEGKYDISRYPDDQGSFMFHYYVDGQENSIPYVPPIYSAEGNFSYESLYAVEQNDGYGRIYYLTYLCSAIGTPYFTERIELPEGDDAKSAAKRKALLEEYGLTESERTTVTFVYGERDKTTNLIVEGSEKTRHVTIGKKAVSGVGYYFMVADNNEEYRNCVYYTQSEYFKYALVGFHKFVKGMLVAEGIASDSTYEPYLTTDFKTWVGTTYKEESDKVFVYTNSERDQGYENPEVIVGAGLKVPIDKGLDYTPDSSDFNGYNSSDKGLYTFDLEGLKSREDYKRIAAALVGKNVGSYENDKILITLLNAIYTSESKLIDFGADYGSVTYDYEISAIESVISDEGERISGQVTADDSLVKVTYRYTVGGVTVKHDCHAVIDLNDLSSEDKAKLVGKDIGALVSSETISFTYYKNVSEYTVERIDAVIKSDGTEKTSGTVLSGDNDLRIIYSVKYNGVVTETGKSAVINIKNSDDAIKFRGCDVGKDFDEKDQLVFRKVDTNSKATNEKYVVTEIISIFDENALQTDVITNTTYVNLSYYREVGGVKGSVETAIVRLCDIKDTDRLAPLKTELMGKTTGKLANNGFTVYNTDYYYECMREFATYEIYSIDFFVVNELIASFRFLNASYRDPYYGDTFFENTLKNQYKLYGLNADSCEQVVKYFGGIGTDSSSALGFAGETVAVGLTIENMQKYGLYAHRIYFKLPRGIYDASEGTEGDSSDQLSDYGWYGELGFTLYISEASFDENGTRVRYIGSDMYDLIAKVSDEKLDFLEYDFVDFWARRNLLMMSITKLEKIKLDFNMSDLKGEYDFDITFDTYYSGYINNQYYSSYEYFEGSSPLEEQHVNVSTTSDSFNTKIKEFMEASADGKYVYGLTPLYNKTMGDGNVTYYPGSYDTLGTAYFNATYEIMQLTRYQGRLTEEEQAKAYENGCIFSMNMKVQGAEDYYTYDFHRLDDRRIMVSLYRTDADGKILSNGMKVSNFYITTFAFKKIVGSYVNLLNGLEVDEEIAYPYY